MSRKRGKKQKGTEPRVEAVPDDLLAEGSGPVARADEDAVATVEDVVTTDDIATTDDVITPDDVVATPSQDAPREPEVKASEPASEPVVTKGKGKRKKRKAEPEPDPEGSEASDISDEALPEPAPMSADSMSNAETAELIDAAVRAAEPATSDDTAPARAAVDGSDGDSETAQGEASDGEGEGDGDGEEDEDAEDAAGVFPTSAGSMDSVQLKHLVESLVFASDKPLTVPRLRQLTRCGDARRLELALTELSEDYKDRGVVLQQVSGGYQFRTRTQFSAWVQQLIAGRPVRLSRAQLETLAIIAYRQPITRPEIDDIRGVDSTATLKLLLDRMLIRALGKREEVGRPTLYGTTKEFLDFFSLGDLRELPTLREYSELSAESRKVMSERLGIAVEDEVPSAPALGLYDDPPERGAGEAEAAPAADAETLAAFYAAADAVDRSDAEAEDDEAPAKRSIDDLAARFADRDEDEPTTDAEDSLSLDDLAVDLDDEAPASLAVDRDGEVAPSESGEAESEDAAADAAESPEAAPAAGEAESPEAAPVAGEAAPADEAAPTDEAPVDEAGSPEADQVASDASAPAEAGPAADEAESDAPAPVDETAPAADAQAAPVADEGESQAATDSEIAPDDDRPVERPAMETQAFEANSLDDAPGAAPDANPHSKSGD